MMQFTNAEQSRHLMFLGIPVETADCYLDYDRPYIIQDPEITNLILMGRYLPSWSVGRLVLIYEAGTGQKYKHDTELTFIEDIISKLDASINTNKFDFSKLN